MVGEECGVPAHGEKKIPSLLMMMMLMVEVGLVMHLESKTSL